MTDIKLVEQQNISAVLSEHLNQRRIIQRGTFPCEEVINNVSALFWLAIFEVFLDYMAKQNFYIKPLTHLTSQIKSLLLSHHHTTSAMVSKILESVLQTVQQNNLHIDSTYLQTYTEENLQKKAHTYTQYTQCTIKASLVINYTLYTVCTRLHYVHIYT